MPALIVSVEPPPAVTDVGLRVAVAPVGTPETVSEIVSALPEITAVLMVDGLDAPCARERLEGEALMEKSFTGVTVSVTVVA